MKKEILKLWVLLLVIVPFLAGCSSEDDVSLGMATIVFDDSEIVVKDGQLSKAITGTITAPLGAEINSYTVTAIYIKNDQENQTNISDGVTEVSGSKKGKYTFRFDGETAGIKENVGELARIRIAVEVKGGDSSTKELTIRQEVSDEDDPGNDALSDAADFEWKRVGASAGTGLEEFGLLWTSNTSTSAIIKADSRTKLVRLSESDWDRIETKGQLKSAVDDGTDLDQYDGVSVTSASRTYDDVLAVDVKGEGVYYILHITNSTVLSENTGTTVTIKGQSRN